MRWSTLKIVLGNPDVPYSSLWVWIYYSLQHFPIAARLTYKAPNQLHIGYAPPYPYHLVTLVLIHLEYETTDYVEHTRHNWRKPVYCIRFNVRVPFAMLACNRLNRTRAHVPS